jgi:hypothetical protein
VLGQAQELEQVQALVLALVLEQVVLLELAHDWLSGLVQMLEYSQ